MRELRQRIERAYEWDSVASPAPRGYDPPLALEAIELPASVLDDYVGEYRPGDGVILTIALENGALSLRHSVFGSATLLAADVDHFFLEAAPVEVLFGRDDAGAVSSLTTVQGRQRQIAPKVR
jgi:hypothetical protein